MDENMMKYICTDIMVTHIISEKRKTELLNKRVNRLNAGFAIFAFVTAVYISALVSTATDQHERISKLTEVIKELKNAKGE